MIIKCQFNEQNLTTLDTDKGEEQLLYHEGIEEQLEYENTESILKEKLNTELEKIKQLQNTNHPKNIALIISFLTILTLLLTTITSSIIPNTFLFYLTNYGIMATVGGIFPIINEIQHYFKDKKEYQILINRVIPYLNESIEEVEVKIANIKKNQPTIPPKPGYEYNLEYYNQAMEDSIDKEIESFTEENLESHQILSRRKNHNYGK